MSVDENGGSVPSRRIRSANNGQRSTLRLASAQEEQNALLERRGNLKASGVASTRAMEKKVQERLHQELFKLNLTEEEDREQLEVLGKKSASLEKKHALVSRHIEEVQSSLESLNPAPEDAVAFKEMQIKEEEARLAKLLKKKDKQRGKYETQFAKGKAELEDLKNLLGNLEKEVFYLQQKLSADAPIPGPYCLVWVEGDTFAMISIFIILSNLFVMFVSLQHPDLDFDLVNNLFLVYYVFELAVHVILKQWTFWIGKFNVVVWNWLDTVIVASGVVDFSLGACGQEAGPWLGALRVLRVARLARIFKIVKFIFASDLAWTEGHAFQSAMMVVIGFNTLFMGVTAQWPDCVAWPYVENFLLMIYIFELTVQFAHHGRNFLIGAEGVVWHWLDLVIVAGAVFDQWLRPAVQLICRLMDNGAQPDSGGIGGMMSILRMARLARILRLARMVKSIPPLYTLVVGIAKAMQGMTWVLVLTIGLLYTCSIIGVQLIGEGMILPSSMSNTTRREVEGVFPDVPNALFTLFQAMNADLGGLEPLIKELPLSKYAIMMFMIVTNWAIFSILTASVSDNMSKVTDAHIAHMEEEAELALQRARHAKLEALFSRLDSNCSDFITIGEFRASLGDKQTKEELIGITGFQEEDLLEIFGLLAKNHGEDSEMSISCSDFVNLLNKEELQVESRTLAKLNRRLTVVGILLQDPEASTWGRRLDLEAKSSGTSSPLQKPARRSRTMPGRI